MMHGNSGSKNSPQRSRINTVVYGATGESGLIVLTVVKEINGEPAFIGDLEKAVVDDQSFCEDQGCLGRHPLRCDKTVGV